MDVLAKVDASKEGELAKEHFIQGFPTLSLFRYGEKVGKFQFYRIILYVTYVLKNPQLITLSVFFLQVEDYKGERTADAIVEYMLKMNDPNWRPPPSPVVELVSENFTSWVKNKDIALVMWYAPWCKHCKQVKPGNYSEVIS